MAFPKFHCRANMLIMGVIIDNRLTFSDHISACCLKAARQLNALARISIIAVIIADKRQCMLATRYCRRSAGICPFIPEG